MTNQEKMENALHSLELQLVTAKRITAQLEKMVIGLTEDGYRVGEGHHNAKLSDAQVEHIRDLHEYHGVSYQKLATLYSTSKNTIASICNYRRRAATAMEFKTVQRQRQNQT